LAQPPLGVVTGPNVTLDAGTRTAAEACPDLAGLARPVESPVDGVVVDPGPMGPLAHVTSYGRCRSIAGLHVCPGQADQYAVLVLRVRLPSGAHVAVEIGLAGDGQTARTIFYSLRPA
jgi:hypothetical protein